MPRPKSLKPAYCHHKASGRAFVVLDGDFKYLGLYGSQKSRDAYDKAIAEWITRGRRPAPSAIGSESPTKLSVVSLIASFWEHAQKYYVHADGTPTSEQENLRQALRPLRRLYGNSPAADFGPLKLKAVRGEMIRLGLARTNINKQVSRLKLVFRWATEDELIPATVYHALSAVAGLKLGRSEARETEPVEPVSEEDVQAVL